MNRYHIHGYSLSSVEPATGGVGGGGIETKLPHRTVYERLVCKAKTSSKQVYSRQFNILSVYCFCLPIYVLHLITRLFIYLFEMTYGAHTHTQHHTIAWTTNICYVCFAPFLSITCHCYLSSAPPLTLYVDFSMRFQFQIASLRFDWKPKWK